MGELRHENVKIMLFGVTSNSALPGKKIAANTAN